MSYMRSGLGQSHPPQVTHACDPEVGQEPRKVKQRRGHKGLHDDRRHARFWKRAHALELGSKHMRQVEQGHGSMHDSERDGEDEEQQKLTVQQARSLAALKTDALQRAKLTAILLLLSKELQVDGAACGEEEKAAHEEISKEQGRDESRSVLEDCHRVSEQWLLRVGQS